MKGHKGHHHHHGEKVKGVHHYHPRAEHARGGKAAEGFGKESPADGDKYHDESPLETYEGQKSHVQKEAKERKRGGKVDGMKAKHRADRKPRKSGGRTGSNFNPLSSAHGEAFLTLCPVF